MGAKTATTVLSGLILLALTTSTVSGAGADSAGVVRPRAEVAHPDASSSKPALQRQSVALRAGGQGGVHPARKKKPQPDAKSLDLGCITSELR